MPENTRDLAQVAAGLTAAIGVLASLAVNGVIAAALRNHGLLLLWAFTAVTFGGLFWVLAGLVEG
jgi:hypothetical protein